MDEKYLIKTVREDLLFLKDKWTQDIDEVSLRISSTILRKLLVENKLSQVWRLVGFEKEPQVVATDLDAFLDGTPKRRINFASAGGAIYKGGQVSGMIIYDTAMSDSFLKKRCEIVKRKSFLKAFMLSDFVKSGCILVTQRFSTGMIQEVISRRELIQYIVNKLGGAHIDLKRNPGKDQKFLLLDNVLEQIKIVNFEPVYYELLSIGQSVIQSQDIHKLLDRLDNLKI